MTPTVRVTASVAAGVALVLLVTAPAVINSLGPCYHPYVGGEEGIGGGIFFAYVFALAFVVGSVLLALALFLTGRRVGATMVVGLVAGIAVAFFLIGQVLNLRAEDYSEAACMATEPSPPPTPPNVPATLELQLIEPMPRDYRGDGLCDVEDDATRVTLITAATPDQRPFSAFRDGDTVVEQLEVRPGVDPVGSVGLFLVLIDQDTHDERTYQATLGPRDSGPAPWSGKVTFSEVAPHVDPNRGATVDGEAISGSISWTCQPPN